MRRSVALLLIVVLTGFLIGSTEESCDEPGDCRDACHPSCLDGCATAPLPRPALPVAAIASRSEAPPVPPASTIRRAELPEVQPPRA